MSELPPYRSLLSVPASSERFLSSALAHPADGLMIDLEDAVPLELKAAARERAVRWISDTDLGPRRITVRLNDVVTELGRHDLAALRQLPGVEALVVPKADRRRIDIARGASSAPLIALIETGHGVEDAAAIATAPLVAGLVFGPVDYLLDLSSSGAWHASDTGWAKGRIVNAAAAGRRWAMAGPVTALGDAAALRREADSDRRLGFAGKLCIHPAQLAIVNGLFAPSPEQLVWAARVVEAAERGDRGGAFRLGDQMIDTPLLLQAQALLGAQAVLGAGRSSG